MRYVLGVFSRPVIKDWAFWLACAWAVLLTIATFADPTTADGEEMSGPVWLNAIGIGAVSFFLFGWTVAGVRRLFRIARDRRSRKTSNSHTHPVSVEATYPREPSPQAQPEPSSGTAANLAPPTQFAGYTGAGLRESDALSLARSDYPYPVARAARAVQMTQDPLEQYQHMLDLGEHLTLTIGMLSASWLRSHDPSNAALETLHGAYVLRGVSQGHWHEVINGAARAMATSANPVPGFVDSMRTKRGGVGLLADLKHLLEERNRAAHGARPHNRAEAAARAVELAPFVVTAVERSTFLTKTELFLVESVALRRQDRRWNVRIRRAMGDHPDFDASNVVLDHALVNDTFYAMADSEPLDLTPMLVMRYCGVCRQPEVCHADRVDPRHGVALKSFARGHEVFDQGLVADVHTLTHGFESTRQPGLP